MFGDWQGQLLIAGLRTQSIGRVAVDASANAARRGRPLRIAAPPARYREAPDGALWVIEDGADGRLLRLTPKG